MAKLNQIIAIDKGIKARAYAEVSELHKSSQKPDLFNGFNKEYRPLNDADEKLPPERKRVQHSVSDVMRTVSRTMTELFNVTSRKDWTNCVARGTVSINGTVILADAPVSYLLFLEKQMNDLHTFVSKLPVLDDAENWTLDPNSGLYKSDMVSTHRTKKVQKPIVMYDATPEHPAQTQLITEDVITGYWHTVKQSGAMPRPEKQALLDRLEKLVRAIKEAREAANMTDEVPMHDIGAAVFNYLMPEG